MILPVFNPKLCKDIGLAQDCASPPQQCAPYTSTIKETHEYVPPVLKSVLRKSDSRIESCMELKIYA